ncbi:MAG: CHC2 zinc finger domain-containing protein [Anaerolineales bacterium]
MKQHADFLPILARYGVELEDSGNERKALCPFHGERTVSYKVNLKKKAFNCFGCGAHGNVLDLVAEIEKPNLREAATIVADCCGIEVSERAGSEGSK